MSLNWNASRRWRIRPGYAYLNSRIRLDPASQQTGTNVAGDLPRNMLQLRSVIDLSGRVEFDQSLYYSARVPGSPIPGRTRLDLRLSRKLGESAEIGIVGQNLLRPRTWEFGDSYGVLGTQVERSVYGQLKWRF
jgi:iron complex outermembrane receptor protein